MLYSRKVKVIDGKVVSFRYVPTEAKKQQLKFAKLMEQSDWMPEASMKQILDAYNEAFANAYYGY